MDESDKCHLKCYRVLESEGIPKTPCSLEHFNYLLTRINDALSQAADS